MTAARGGLILAGIALVLGACNTPQRAAPFDPPARAAPPPVAAAPPPPSALGPVLAPDGVCTGAAPGTASAIDPGIGECDLVRLKGKPPTDVLVGESGKGQREVQVLYNEPGGRELYFFTDNRLTRTVKPSAG
jgi:hypothetical protein